MRAYQDKTTGKWKWGTRGNPVHESKEAAERYAIDTLTDKLRIIIDKRSGVCRQIGK